jgi:hypothetical protein
VPYKNFSFRTAVLPVSCGYFWEISVCRTGILASVLPNCPYSAAFLANSAFALNKSHTTLHTDCSFLFRADLELQSFVWLACPAVVVLDVFTANLELERR